MKKAHPSTLNKVVIGSYNIPKMKIAKNELLKQITAIFDKYEISKSDRSQLHNMIRGVGMIKLRIKNYNKL